VERFGHRARPVRLLDVGPGYATVALHRWLGHRVEIDTLGWWDDTLVPPETVVRHIDFDLNDAQSRDCWPDPTPHDVVVLAEVLEHLHTAPRLVLSCLSTFLEPDGVLVVQTPNAASLRKRVKLAMGRHPYEMIRETPTDPGHFREYTGGELRTILDASGFRSEELIRANYWGASSESARGESGGTKQGGRRRLERVGLPPVADRAAAMVERLVPSFRQGLTAVAVKRADR
jgi:hypothetical protein